MLGRRLAERELGKTPPAPRKNFFVHEWISEKLDYYTTFTGHEECVNTLKWNADGRLLLSAGDDRTIKVWSLDGRLLHNISTCHGGNIFGVEWLPSSSDRIVISCAADKMVKMTDLVVGEIASWQAYKRVKRIATSPAHPHLVWSIAEDSILREYDTRTYTVSELAKTVGAGKSLSVSPLRPEYIALASEDLTVPIFDRRNMSSPIFLLAPADSSSSPHLMPINTHVSFSSQSLELLVHNMSEGCVFVFDLNNPTEPDFLEKLSSINADRSEMENIPKGMDDRKVRLLEKRALTLLELDEVRKYLDRVNAMLANTNLTDKDRSLLLLRRAVGLKKRNWAGDGYACARDCADAVAKCPRRKSALLELVDALFRIEQYSMAEQVLHTYNSRFPEYNERSKKLMVQIEEKKNTCSEDVRLVMGGIHRDYKERLMGHSNQQTDIKEANFFGPRDEFVVAGSDCGHVFLWERSSGRVKACFEADRHIVNVVQPHPVLPLLASSGIDRDILFWLPRGADRASGRRKESEEGLGRDAYLGQLLLFQRLGHIGQAEGVPGCITQ